jgi:hypothetical protein
MMQRPSLPELTAEQLLQRAVECAAKAIADDTLDFTRGAYHRLALRYEKRAAEREIEEAEATRHYARG